MRKLRIKETIYLQAPISKASELLKFKIKNISNALRDLSTSTPELDGAKHWVLSNVDPNFR